MPDTYPIGHLPYLCLNGWLCRAVRQPIDGAMMAFSFNVRRLGRLFFGAVLLVLAGMTPSYGQSSLESYQDRLAALEQGLKEVRGVIEEDIRALKDAIQSQDNSRGNTAQINDAMDKLADQLTALSNRIERTLEVASDNEFKILRLEKRLDSLVRLTFEDGQTAPNNTAPNDTAENTADNGQTRPTATGAGDVPAAGIVASEDNSSVWTIDKDELEKQIDELPNPEDAARQSPDNSPDNSAPDTPDNSTNNPASAQATNQLTVLPDASSDEQFEFSLGKALQNNLPMAEKSFAEFLAIHPDHERVHDATFWLGRVQYMQGSYEEAVKTFSSFNQQWPEDARREKTTLWIGESVSHFASSEDTCSLLSSLPGLIEDPSESFYKRLADLKQKSNCPE